MNILLDVKPVCLSLKMVKIKIKIKVITTSIVKEFNMSQIAMVSGVKLDSV